ncbi:MAG TPA: aminotransferase class III-fold pyridoxal phosphate-dependent enzyme, partial [Candidatus Omnitrophota bacterium]|nr:aminotransferase class III-fold pyridoxal phosphate-dependent enzyme [Candidatus Omnitrophota bacterium]
MRPEEIRRLESWDKKYIWHPFTQMKEWSASRPVVIEKGEGNYLVDTRGRRYLDGVSSLWCNVHGHRVKELDRALKSQLAKIAHTTFLGLSNVPAIELSKRLIDLAPKGLTKAFYSDSGSAAVEVALKMAYQYWKQKGFREKKTFLKLKNAYHGDTLGSVSVGGIELFHEIFNPLLF